ncbi:MAG: N-acetylmuramoyl-L-alanine amidase [Saprospiraceae bacterium]|nr:N-acetylmuramoyl-L-alanine amidase [Saprospiraceae bacterium]
MKKLLFQITIFLALSSAGRAESPTSYLPHHKGHSKKVVVIDAGHGGHDPGAVGKHHKEKDLALQMALKLGGLIEQKFPYIEVVFTRNNDVFLPLYQRVGIANKLKADLFISIHCNYITNSRTKGTETFVMGLHRAAENLAVAQRENEVILMENDYENNYEGYDPNSPVGHIVLSSFQDAYLEKSLDFASKIERNLANRGLSTSRGVKQAGFAVLRRATMPSVLIETGFISNEDEEKWLSSTDGQYQICASIAVAVESFFAADRVQWADTNPKTPESVTSPQEESVTVPATKSSYSIQIAAMKSKADPKLLVSLEPIGKLNVFLENGYYKYQLGEYITQEEAESAKRTLKELGYSGAFVVKKL